MDIHEADDCNDVFFLKSTLVLQDQKEYYEFFKEDLAQILNVFRCNIRP